MNGLYGYVLDYLFCVLEHYSVIYPKALKK